MIDLRADSMRLSGKGTGGLQFGPSSVIVLVRSRRQKVSTMTDRTTLNVTINGTGFAGDYTARTYGMIPHRNGVDIRLAGVTSGRMPNVLPTRTRYNPVSTTLPAPMPPMAPAPSRPPGPECP